MLAKCFIMFCDLVKRSKRKNDGDDVAKGVDYGVASFSSWSKSICNPVTCIRRIRGSPTTSVFYQGSCATCPILEHNNLAAIRKAKTQGSP